MSDQYRNALMWAFDRLGVDGGMTPKEQLHTMREIGKVLCGRPSPAATYKPSDWDSSAKLPRIVTVNAPTSATVILRAKLTEIVARVRKYAPSLRGVGMTASDASYNRMLQDADYIAANIKHVSVGHEALADVAGIERGDAQRKVIALMVDALLAACRGECDYSLRKQQDALAAAVAVGLAEGVAVEDLPADVRAALAGIKVQS